MKKLLLIAILSSLTAKAQTNVYYRFPDSNAVWNEKWSAWYCSGGAIYPHEELYSYLITGDTTFGGFTYHKLAKHYIQMMDTCHGSLPFNIVGYAGCYREDTSAKKVFYVPVSSNTEYVLYDYNLNVGDTMPFHFGWGCISIIWSVDSIFIDGNFRKRWQWSDQGGNDTGSVIQGMGCTGGLLEPFCEGIDAPYVILTCFKQDNTVLYLDSLNATNCEIIDAVKDIPELKISVILSPNPFHSSALLEVSSEFANAELKLYNSLGSLIREERIPNEKTFLLNRNELHNGVFFLQLINDKGQRISEKIVVE